MIQQHDRFAPRVLHWVENFRLGIFLLGTLVAGFQELRIMVDADTATLTDLLQLLLCLEIVTMLGLYYKQGQLPVRFQSISLSSRWRVVSFSA
ncbi:hypothetical protein SFMTTN_3444 [Sulfuriferula multivorans]|uniref:Uncharacterized protein n=1 Tax=Sulfuriferula multivorans TaxID=1559896 RepID=A0A401K099_9PROT|nr:hypothetical protein [Sulfuriferula multivorans]GCB02327.1 hypothetical protein SFMTTN_3444 [Sulfuriferula multivorans]